MPMLERPQIEEAIAERFAAWRDRLLQEDATPLILIGIGHNGHSGQIVVCTLDEPEVYEPQVLAAFLRKAAIELDPTQRRAL